MVPDRPPWLPFLRSKTCAKPRTGFLFLFMYLKIKKKKSRTLRLEHWSPLLPRHARWGSVRRHTKPPYPVAFWGQWFSWGNAGGPFPARTWTVPPMWLMGGFASTFRSIPAWMIEIPGVPRTSGCSDDQAASHRSATERGSLVGDARTRTDPVGPRIPSVGSGPTRHSASAPSVTGFGSGLSRPSCRPSLAAEPDAFLACCCESAVPWWGKRAPPAHPGPTSTTTGPSVCAPGWACLARPVAILRTRTVSGLRVLGCPGCDSFRSASLSPIPANLDFRCHPAGKQSACQSDQVMWRIR